MRAAFVDDESPFARALRDGHAQGVEQRVVVGGGTAGRGQVVADDERVRTGEQAHRLQLAQHALAAAGEAQPRTREDEPEQRDRLQRLARGEHGVIGERCAGTRIEQVDRHLARIELGELEHEVDSLVERLTHAENAAAAQLHARVLREAARLRE